MRLITQPDDGTGRIVKGIRKAKKSVEIMIFRLDRPEIERALIDAVERGLFVHALIAFTNRGGEEQLRKLEMRFLDSGITVARTSGDLVRYHGKMMIVDRRELYILGFNFTHLDVDRSRSFGLITRSRKLVAEAGKLFEADTKRQNYTAGNADLLVSPVNARKELARFLKGAERELLIYDPKVSDREMLGILDERRKAGVEVRILGAVAGCRLPSCALKRMRLHTRTIIRDRTHGFIGSQSLRRQELDQRREIGIIFCDGSALKELIQTFEKDWSDSASRKLKKLVAGKQAPQKEIKRVARVVARKIALKPVTRRVVKILAKKTDVKEEKVNDVVRDIVKEVAEEAARKAAAEAAKTVA